MIPKGNPYSLFRNALSSEIMYNYDGSGMIEADEDDDLLDQRGTTHLPK
jgi:hypothetical protein